MSIVDFGLALLKRATTSLRISSCGLPDRVQYVATPLPLPDPPPAPVWLGEPPHAARATLAGTPSPTSRRKLRRDVFIGSIFHLHVDGRDHHGSSVSDSTPAPRATVR